MSVRREQRLRTENNDLRRALASFRETSAAERVRLRDALAATYDMLVMLGRITSTHGDKPSQEEFDAAAERFNKADPKRLVSR